MYMIFQRPACVLATTSHQNVFVRKCAVLVMGCNRHMVQTRNRKRNCHIKESQAVRKIHKLATGFYHLNAH